MNWDQVEGKWKQLKGSAKQQWAKLTDDDLAFISGKKDELVGKIQERYGVSKDEAHKQADLWSKELQRQADEEAKAADAKAARGKL